MKSVTYHTHDLQYAMKKLATHTGAAKQPHLRNMAIKGDKLTYTDIDSRITITVPVYDSTENFAATIDWYQVDAFCRNVAPSGNIKFTWVGDTSIRVECVGTSNALTIPGTPYADYPEWVEPVVPEPDQRAERYTTKLSLPAKELLAALQYVTPTMPKADVRYYLNGVLFETDLTTDNKVTLVATDGHMLLSRAIGEASFDGQVMDMAAMPREPWNTPYLWLPIVPHDEIKQLVRLLTIWAKDGNEEVTLTTTMRLVWPVREVVGGPTVPRMVPTIQIETHGDTLSLGYTVDGVYPHYRRVIPARAARHVVVPGDVLSAMLKTRIEQLKHAEYKGIRAEVFPNGQLIGTSRVDEILYSAEIQTNYTYTGSGLPTFVFGVSATLLARVFPAGKKRDVHIYFDDADPGTTGFRVEIPDAGIVGVIMPMRL